MTIDPHRNLPIAQLGAPLSEASGVMILLHGRGGSAEDMFSLGEDLGGRDFAYLAPTAANNTWYPYSFLSPLDQNEPYLTSALNKVQSVVQLAAAAGIPSNSVVLVGFSQGACLATEYVARYPRRYAGLVAFTGGLIGASDSDLVHPGDLTGTPAFLGSGDPGLSRSMAARPKIRRSIKADGCGCGIAPLPRYASFGYSRGDRIGTSTHSFFVQPKEAEGRKHSYPDGRGLSWIGQTGS